MSSILKQSHKKTMHDRNLEKEKLKEDIKLIEQGSVEKVEALKKEWTDLYVVQVEHSGPKWGSRPTLAKNQKFSKPCFL